MSDLLPQVSAAVAAVRDQFADTTVSVTPDGCGGAFVIVESVAVGDVYAPNSTWLGFQISAAYPSADVYPHYIGVVARTDGKQNDSAVQPVTWQERSALQLSRRSNGWQAGIDNAALKAQKVITWFATQELRPEPVGA